MTAREANLALAFALGSWVYGIACWAIAYETSIPVAGARALMLSSCLIGIVLDVLAIAYGKRAREATPAGDPLRGRIAIAMFLAWLSLAGIIGLGAISVACSGIASP